MGIHGVLLSVCTRYIFFHLYFFIMRPSRYYYYPSPQVQIGPRLALLILILPLVAQAVPSRMSASVENENSVNNPKKSCFRYGADGELEINDCLTDNTVTESTLIGLLAVGLLLLLGTISYFVISKLSGKKYTAAQTKDSDNVSQIVRQR